METKTVQVVWFNGREFRRVTWRNVEGIGTVIVTFAVWKHIRPGVMHATFMGRRVI